MTFPGHYADEQDRTPLRFSAPVPASVVRAGLDPEKVTPHVMRHTGITRLVKARVHLPTIQRISGHKTLAMVMRYVHLEDNQIDDAIAAIDTDFLNSVTHRLHTPDIPAPKGRA
ncbi:tyrosine-type recombinase/integrase [Altererythrobacter salegens]|uniref:Tyrosine-type recombinase/integrase n=1 Tax=Croceibacterium salegens TaxID=1737568 RepID=A0A6I4SY63_9SPHN|nr:tyrosine-type recombinase/integrase [Croceibacterium salegens]